MTKTQYGIRKAKHTLERNLIFIDLLSVPHRNRVLTVGYPAFGLNKYYDNLAEMQRTYSHSVKLSRISFRPLTTSESISVVAYEFRNMAKTPEIIDLSLLQLGRVLRTQDGVYVNLPLNAQGNPITDESTLKQLLDKSRKVGVGKGHIYLGEKDFGFAEYDTFQRGVQDCDTFASSGLAKVLEFTLERTARNLRAIASPKFYKRGVNVWEFDPANQSISGVMNFYSSRHKTYGNALNVGSGWVEAVPGYAFGGLVPSENNQNSSN